MNKILDSIWREVKLFFSKEWKLLQRYVIPAIDTLNVIKQLTDSAIADVVVLLTPTGLDDALLHIIREKLPLAIRLLEIDVECRDKATPEEVVSCFVTKLATLSPSMRDAVVFKLASLLSRLTAGEKYASLSDSDFDFLVQLAYKKQKEK